MPVLGMKVLARLFASLEVAQLLLSRPLRVVAFARHFFFLNAHVSWALEVRGVWEVR